MISITVSSWQDDYDKKDQTMLTLSNEDDPEVRYPSSGKAERDEQSCIIVRPIRSLSRYPIPSYYCVPKVPANSRTFGCLRTV